MITVRILEKKTMALVVLFSRKAMILSNTDTDNSGLNCCTGTRTRTGLPYI